MSHSVTNAPTLSYGAETGVNHGNIYNTFTNNFHAGHQSDLENFPVAFEALLNAAGKEDDPDCLPGTRVEVLKDIDAWIQGNDERHIFWLSGWAGCGKSTIARTIARKYQNELSGASFFFSRGSGDAANATKFVTTIAYQLSCKIPAYQNRLNAVLSKNRYIPNQTLIVQWTELICDPFSSIQDFQSDTTILVVIDALDECENESHAQLVVRLLRQVKQFARVRFRVLVTSRPEVYIRDGFWSIERHEYQDLILHNIADDIANRDVHLYLKSTLEDIRRRRSLHSDWPGHQAIATLTARSAGLMIWAATACKFIDAGKQRAAQRLSTLLLDNSLGTGPQRELDKIYVTVIHDSLKGDLSDTEKREICQDLSKILGAIVAIFSPLSVSRLASLLELPLDSVSPLVNELHAILEVPSDPRQPIRPHHPSFRDFLIDTQRCTIPYLSTPLEAIHLVLAEHCMNQLFRLKRDVCKLQDMAVHVRDISWYRINRFISIELRYACTYWFDHLYQARESSIHLKDKILQFLETQFVYWLEVMIIVGRYTLARRIVKEMRLITWISNRRVRARSRHSSLPRESDYSSSSSSSALSEDDEDENGDSSVRISQFLHSASRFIRTCTRCVVYRYPLQLYAVSMMYTRPDNRVRKHFEHAAVISGTTRQIHVPAPGMKNKQSTVSPSYLSMHKVLKSMVPAPLGHMIAAGYDETAVRCWNLDSDTKPKILGPLKREITSISFSSDCQFLAVGSCSGEICVWHLPSGTRTDFDVQGNSSWIETIAISPSNDLVASGCFDPHVRLWNMSTRQIHSELRGHSSGTNVVYFSPSGRLLASGSRDTTIRIWNVSSGLLHTILQGHSLWMTALTFSPNEQFLASASLDKTVRLWQVQSGQQIGSHAEAAERPCLGFDPSSKTLYVRFMEDETRPGSPRFIEHYYSAEQNAEQNARISVNSDVTMSIPGSTAWLAIQGKPIMLIPPKFIRGQSFRWGRTVAVMNPGVHYYKKQNGYSALFIAIDHLADDYAAMIEETSKKNLWSWRNLSVSTKLYPCPESTSSSSDSTQT